MTHVVMHRGTRFGRYEILMKLAQGGMATVYLARSTGVGGFEKIVALKVMGDHLANDSESVHQFLDEARLGAQLQHPNAVMVFDMGHHDDIYYIVMEYVPSENLNQVMRAASTKHAAFDWSLAFKIAGDVAAGLHAAHELADSTGSPMGLLHRDVSPFNILVAYDGNVKVADFGVAFAAERLSRTATGILKGKAAFMAPERILGQKVDRRSDIFSLGVVLWESVLLRPLFRDQDPTRSLVKIRDGAIPRPRSIRPEIPSDVEQVILQALAYRPENRYQTMAEFEADIQRVLSRHGKSGLRSALAQFMTEEFDQHRKEIEQELRSAIKSLQARRGAPQSRGDSQESDGPTRTHAWWQVGLGAAIVVALLAFGVRRLSNRHTDSPHPEKGHTTSPNPLRAPNQGTGGLLESQWIDVSIQVFPVGAHATIRLGDKTYHANQLHLHIHPYSGQAALTVSAKGFVSETRVLDMRRSQRLVIRLKPDGTKEHRIRPRVRHRQPRSRAPRPVPNREGSKREGGQFWKFVKPI